MLLSCILVMHMRTTLDLPEDLVEEAQRLSGLPSKRAVVVEALEEFIGAKLRAELIGMLGKTPMALKHEELRGMWDGNEDPDPDQPMRLILPPRGRYPCLDKKPPSAKTPS